MTQYVIRRSDGRYVSKPGSERSYCRHLENARLYPSRDAAEADRCPGNEYVEPSLPEPRR